MQEQLLLLGPEQEGLKEPSAMPATLVEVLTITNDDDAVFLSSDGGLEAIAAALDRAIVRYVEMSQLD
jgi:N-acetylmuramoyl-L-alanine amidase